MDQQASEQRQGRFKLLLFAGFVFLVAAGALASGLMKREEIRALAGPLHVNLENAADVRLRADLFVGDEYATLELEPGRSGMVRFSPKEPQPIDLQLLRKNRPTKALRHGTYQPEERAEVRFVFLSDSEVRVEELPVPAEGASD